MSHHCRFCDGPASVDEVRSGPIETPQVSEAIRSLFDALGLDLSDGADVAENIRVATHAISGWREVVGRARQVILDEIAQEGARAFDNGLPADVYGRTLEQATLGELGDFREHLRKLGRGQVQEPEPIAEEYIPPPDAIEDEPPPSLPSSMFRTRY